MEATLAIKMAARNLRRHARRALNTLLVMCIGFVTCTVLFGYVEANLEMTRDAFIRWGARGHLMIESPLAEGTTQEDAAKALLPRPTQESIESILRADPRIRVYARLLEISGMVNNGRTNAIFAGLGEDVEQIRAIKGPLYEYDVVAGQPLWMSRGQSALIIGQELARLLGCQVPNVGFAPRKPNEAATQRGFSCQPQEVQLSVSTESGQFNAQKFPATGIMDWGIKEINQRLVVLPLKIAQELLNTESISKYHVELVDPTKANEVRAELAQAFAQRGLALKIFHWSDRAVFYHQVRGMLRGFLAFVLAMALLISFMSLLNTSYVTILGRIREFGTLRSIGFSKNFVLLLCALESSGLALLAGAIGLVGSTLITLGIRAADLSWVPPGSSNAIPITIMWTLKGYAVALLLLLGLAVLASYLPTRLVVRKQIHEALADL